MPKKAKTQKLRRRTYRIYGIFDFKKRKLIYVSLDKDEVEFRFDLEGYSEDFNVVSFPIILS